MNGERDWVRSTSQDQLCIPYFPQTLLGIRPCPIPPNKGRIPSTAKAMHPIYSHGIRPSYHLYTRYSNNEDTGGRVGYRGRLAS